MDFTYVPGNFQLAKQGPSLVLPPLNTHICTRLHPCTRRDYVLFEGSRVGENHLVPSPTSPGEGVVPREGDLRAYPWMRGRCGAAGLPYPSISAGNLAPTVPLRVGILGTPPGGSTLPWTVAFLMQTMTASFNPQAAALDGRCW